MTLSADSCLARVLSEKNNLNLCHQYVDIVSYHLPDLLASRWVDGVLIDQNDGDC